jgi:hypothetical protein
MLLWPYQQKSFGYKAFIILFNSLTTSGWNLNWFQPFFCAIMLLRPEQVRAGRLQQ